MKRTRTGTSPAAPDHCTIQSLERRELFAAAANVTAEVIGGVLTIQGNDSKNHSLVIQGQNTVATLVTPGKGTTINGSASPLSFTGSPPIAIDLGNGNDSVVLADLSDQSVTLNTNGGNDVVVGTTASAAQNIFGNLKIDTGSGNDIIHLGGNTGVSNDLTIDAGKGNDIVELVQNTGVGNNLSIQGGDGDDLIHLGGTVFVGGNFSVDGGAGVDLLLKQGATFTIGGTNLTSNVELIV